MMSQRHPIGLWREASGDAAVEFAIVTNVFIACLMGISYMGIMIFEKTSLDWAVQKAIRIAALSNTTTQSDVATAVNGYLTSVGLSNATVSYNVTTSNGLNIATINATFSKTYVVPLIST